MRRRRILTAKRGFTIWAMLVYAFLYLPILVVVVFAFDKPSATSIATFKGSNICNIQPADIGNISVWNGFTSCWFAKGLNTGLYTSAIKTSFFIALEASIIATVLGLGAALALARMKRRWRAPFDVLVYLTLVVPEIVIAVASLIFFVQVRSNFGAFPPLGRDRPSCSARSCSTRRLQCSSSGPGSSGWATSSRRPPTTSARARSERSGRSRFRA